MGVGGNLMKWSTIFINDKLSSLLANLRSYSRTTFIKSVKFDYNKLSEFRHKRF